MLLPILHLFNDGYLAAMPLVLPFAAEEFSIPLSIVGLLGSLLSFSGIILALPAGTAAARFGVVRLLSFAVLCYSIGFLLLGTAGGIAAIFAAFILGSIAFIPPYCLLCRRKGIIVITAWKEYGNIRRNR